MLTILLLIHLIVCKGEWIKISQIPTSEFEMYTTESAVKYSENSENTTPIRYEDLEHIIGPGFEDELEKFYQRHKEEMDRKGNDENQKKILEMVEHYDDPWNVYDKPLHIGRLEESIGVVNTQDSEEQQNRYEEYEEHDHLNNSSLQNYKNATIDAVSSPQKIVRLKFVRVKPKTSETPFGFFGFFQFLRDMQASFVTKTARSIKDKIRTLEQFRDDLMMNIEKRIKSLWPVTPVVRSKRGIMDGHHGGGMEFPSSEAALMTISFLTFAVFLIKLVLVDVMARMIQYNPLKALDAHIIFSLVVQNTIFCSATKLNIIHQIIGPYHDIVFQEIQVHNLTLLRMGILPYDRVFERKYKLRQVINTIKSKHYSYNTFDTTNGGGGTMAAVNIIKQNRNARKLSLTQDDLNGMNNVLSSIDRVGKI